MKKFMLRNKYISYLYSDAFDTFQEIKEFLLSLDDPEDWIIIQFDTEISPEYDLGKVEEEVIIDGILFAKL